jgi:hypothetical protein
MRDLILAAVARHAPLPQQGLEDVDGNIVETLLAAGIEPHVVLSAASAASGVPVARRSWLEGPLPTWPLAFDPSVCRQLGVCPVTFRRGQWVVAYTDPELAAAADHLALPEHVRVLALPADLERFFAAAPDAPAVADPITDSELFAPVSLLQPERSLDGPGRQHRDDFSDDDDDDLELYVDRLAPAPATSVEASRRRSSSAAMSPRAPSTAFQGGPVPDRLTLGMLDPPLPPADCVDRSGLTTGSSGAARSRVKRSRSGEAETSSTSSKSASSPAKPRRFTGAPAMLGRRAWLVGGAVVSTAMCGLVWLVWPSSPPPPPPGAVDAIVVTASGVEVSAAQQMLRKQAQASAEPASARELLTKAIALEPSSLEARTALLERARLAIAHGQLGQADLDIERLRRRSDVDDVKGALDGLVALRRQTRPVVAVPATRGKPP